MAAAEAGVFLTVVYIICLAHGEAALFAPDHEYVYDYHADFRAGALSPSQVVSQWAMKGQLQVQGGTDIITVQLSDLKTSVYNGILETNEQPNVTFSPLPEDAGGLELPFKIQYKMGKAVGLLVDEDEDVWSVNMKRSLASIFQFDLSALDTSAFSIQENLMYGSCQSEYSSETQPERVTVRKFVDHETCSDFPSRRWSNVPQIDCHIEPQNHLVSSSLRFYSIVPMENGMLKAEYISASGGMYLQPFQSHGDAYFALANQTLELKTKTTPIANPISTGEKEVGLVYQVQGSDFSQGRVSINDEELLPSLSDTLSQITDSLDDPILRRDSKSLRNEQLAHCVYLMSMMTERGLETLFSSLDAGTSYHLETRRNLFLKLVPQVGTTDTVSFICKLILGRKVKNETIIDLLNTVPFYLREPSEKLLSRFEEMLTFDANSTNVRHAIVLNFATMIYKTCKHHCTSETLDKYVRLYFDYFTNSNDFAEQMVYLEGLSNIEIGKVFDYLEPVIHGEVSSLGDSVHHIRFLAALATTSVAQLYPDKMYRLFWPILTNRTEHLEMRAAAMVMLGMSRPTTGRFFNLFWFMQTERNPHLKHFYYTTLQSLVDSKYPCFSQLSFLAGQVARFVPPAESRHWVTGYYMLDYSDSHDGYGSLTQLLMVGSERTGFPNVFHLHTKNYADRHMLSDITFYVKLEGVTDVVRQQILRMDADSLEISELVKVLRDAKVSPIRSENVHIELIVKIWGKVIHTLYCNQSNLEAFITGLTNIQFLQGGVHANYQHALVPLFSDEFRPSDLGTSVGLHASIATLVSLRGNFTQSRTASSIIRTNQFDYRYNFNVWNWLTAYNPVLDLWQGARRTKGLQHSIPVNTQLGFNFPQKNLKFVIRLPSDFRTGFSIHKYSDTFVFGNKSTEILKASCPTCHLMAVGSRELPTTHKEEVHNIKIPDLGIQLKTYLLSCEPSLNTVDWLKLLLKVVHDKNINYRVFPLSRPVLALSQAMDYLTHISPPGNCGMLGEVTPIKGQATELEGTISLAIEQRMNETPVEPLPGAKVMVRITLVHKVAETTTPLHSWEMGAVYEYSNGFSKHDIRMKVTRIASNERDNKLCLEAETLFPKWEADQKRVSPVDPTEGHVNIVWGGVDNAIKGKCPKDGTGVRITLHAEVMEEQKERAEQSNSWPFDACNDHKSNVEEWGTYWTPDTEACYQAALELSTLRRYQVTVKYTKLPKTMMLFGSQLATLGAAIDPSLSLSSAGSGVTTTLEFPMSSSHINFKINEKQTKLQLGRTWLDGLLINNRFPKTLQFASHIGFINWCTVSSSRVKTLDQASMRYNLSASYTLAAAECTQHPTFALFVKHVPGQKPLAIKLYIGENYVEITPSNNGDFAYLLNGVVITNATEGFHFPPDDSIYDFKVWQREDGMVEIDSSLTRGWYNYNGHSIILTIHGVYHGQLCGLCGDYNGDGSNDMPVTYTLPTPEA